MANNWNTLSVPTPSWRNTGTLNITSTSTANASILDDLLVALDNPDRVKKFQAYEITEDLLALSCAWFRLRNMPSDAPLSNRVVYVTSLLGNELFDHVVEEDRARAYTIRDYYSKKLMMLSLKGANLTNFRKDLSEYLHGHSNKFNEKMLPLVYRLPEFYEYDTEFDMFKGSFEQEIRKKGKFNPNQHSTVLHPVKSLVVRGKQRKGKDYWLCDDDKNAYLFNVPNHSPMNGLWEREFKKPNIDLTMKVTMGIRDGLHFFNIAQIKEVN